MKTETKRTVLIDLKLVGDQGEFEAVFATLNVVDADDDITIPGAFGNQDVILSQYNHGSWGSGAAALPIGVGKIFERGDTAVIHGEFNLDSEDGLKTYKTIKYLHEKGRTQEWSYALPEIDYEMQEADGRRVRVLKRIKVNEVSPVLMGSGVDTRLLSIKGTFSNADKDELARLGKKFGYIFILNNELEASDQESKAVHIESMPLAEHFEVVQADVERLVERVQKIGDLRDAKGNHPSEDTMKRTAQFQTVLGKLMHELDELRERHQVLYKEFLRFQKIIGERRRKDGTKIVSGKT